MRTRSLLVVLLLLLTSMPALAQRRVVVHHRSPDGSQTASPFQIVFEGGAALPYGDLGDDFVGTSKGLGADTGYELGGRLRYYVSPMTTVGPTFHYANFGDWDDVFTDEFGLAAYSVRTSVYRYGLDIQQFFVDPGRNVRPYLTVGAVFCHNRYVDWVQDDGTFETSSNNLAFGLGGGVAMGPMELSVVYTYNPADNRDLPRAEGVLDTEADWSYLAVRVGIALGRP